MAGQAVSTLHMIAALQVFQAKLGRAAQGNRPRLARYQDNGPCNQPYVGQFGGSQMPFLVEFNRSRTQTKQLSSTPQFLP